MKLRSSESDSKESKKKCAPLHFWISYLIFWQWSERDEIQWRSKAGFKGIVLRWCVYIYTPWTQCFHHYHCDTDPPSHPHTWASWEKLPHKTARTRTTTQLQRKYYCRNFYEHNSTGTCSCAEPLDCLGALAKKHPHWFTNCLLLIICPSNPFSPFLSSPRLTLLNLMKLSSREIK